MPLRDETNNENPKEVPKESVGRNSDCMRNVFPQLHIFVLAPIEARARQVCVTQGLPDDRGSFTGIIVCQQSAGKDFDGIIASRLGTRSLVLM
jgi:hypothetical protein